MFVTARWHRVHHSDDQQYTDAHYADVSTFWDRIFGTAQRVDERTLTPAFLADWLQRCDRALLQQHASAAKKLQNIHATEALVAACEELAP